MKLPNENNRENEDGAKDSLQLPNLENLEFEENEEKYREYFAEIIEKEGPKDTHEELKGVYEKLFENLMSNEVKNTPEIHLELNINSFEELEEAIENGLIDLSQYDTVAISKLMSHISQKEQKRDLKTYPINTVKDFYDLVARGELILSKYDEDEISEFIKKLARR